MTETTPTAPGGAACRQRWKSALAIFAIALVVLLAFNAWLGVSLDQDSWTYMLWGQELASGARLNQASFVSPKILLIGVTAAVQAVPGEHGPEIAYGILTALVGAGLVVLASRLAERIGGSLAGWLAVPLVLGHMQFLRYVVQGQSTVWASAFIAAALVLLTREEARRRDFIWAGVMVFLSAMCRPEAGLLGGAIGLVVLLRLGWRGIGWAVLSGAIAMASLPVNLLFNQVAFGSYSYNVDLVMMEMVVCPKAMPSLIAGFGKSLVKVLFHYANRSWGLLLLIGVGAGLVLAPKRWRQFAALFLFPLATIVAVWLLLWRGYLFNQRCFYHISFVMLPLAAAAVARLATWAGTSEEFLAGLPSRLRTAAFAAIVLGFLAPAYASRPLPKMARHIARLEQGFAFLREQIRDGSGTQGVVVSDDLSHLFYRLRLPADASCVSAARVINGGDGTLPDHVQWGFLDETSKPVDFKPEWGLRLVWEHPSGQVKIYRRGTP